MRTATVAILLVSLSAASAIACTPDDYQQIKDDLAAHGRPAMVQRYCVEFQLWKSALTARSDFGASARSREEARSEFECRNTNISRMQSALGDDKDTQILAGCK